MWSFHALNGLMDDFGRSRTRWNETSEVSFVVSERKYLPPILFLSYGAIGGYSITQIKDDVNGSFRRRREPSVVYWTAYNERK